MSALATVIQEATRAGLVLCSVQSVGIQSKGVVYASVMPCIERAYLFSIACPPDRVPPRGALIGIPRDDVLAALAASAPDPLYALRLKPDTWPIALASSDPKLWPAPRPDFTDAQLLAAFEVGRLAAGWLPEDCGSDAHKLRVTKSAIAPGASACHSSDPDRGHRFIEAVRVALDVPRRDPWPDLQHVIARF